MPGIRFKVGASLDANIGAVFVPLEKAAEKARAKIQSSLGAALGGGGGHPYRSNARGIEEVFDKASQGSKRMARITGQSLSEIKSQLKQYAREAKKDLDLSAIAAQAEREINKVQRQAARARLGFAGGGGFGGGGGGAIGIGRRAGIRVSRGAAALYGYGGAALSTMLNGIGINTDIRSMIQSGVDQESLAQKIINSAPEYNKSSAADRKTGAADVLERVRSVANATATDTTEAMEGLEAFVAKTGELNTGKDVLWSMAKLSRATGTNLADMANAAAEVSNNLGDVPDKTAAIDAVMRSIAGQGKLGAVEIKDLASQMAKIASVSGSFEGDRAETIAMLGGMAQESKARGTSASAQQATTAIQAFVQALVKGPTLKNWAAAGLNPFTDNTHTKLRSPEELVLEALKYSGGDQKKLYGLFRSSQALRAVRGYANIYTDAGGGQKGLDAVHAEFQRFQTAAMTAADVDNAFAAQMDTTKSKVQVLNNEFAQTTQKLANELAPAITNELLPAVLQLAQDFSSVMDSDFLQTLLSPGNKKLEEQDSKTTKAIDDAGNFIAKVHKTFDPLITTSLPLDKLTPAQLSKLRAEDAAHPGARAAMAERLRKEQADAAMSAAQPVLQEENRREFAVAGRINDLKDDMDAAAKDIGGTGFNKPVSAFTADDWKWIQGEASGGNKAAQRLIGDRDSIEKLQGVLDDLSKERDALVQTLLSGNVVVKLAPGGNTPPPAPVPGGSAPVSSPVDGADLTSH